MDRQEPWGAIGQLRQEWHAIARSAELRAGQSLRRTLYGHPLLVWRDQSGQLRALTDACLHQLAPLHVVDYATNCVKCPYHGWEYDGQGVLRSVPSAPSMVTKMARGVRSFPVVESAGFVWIHPQGDPPAAASAPEYFPFALSDWGSLGLQREFQTTEELLIDNFMDPTHTAWVHDGLIRRADELLEHELTVTPHARGVRVDYAERAEDVGLGMRWLFGSRMRVQHTDEFLLPNLVRVIYVIEGEPRFVALIACTPLGPLSSPRTLALVQLYYRFGPWNWLARLVLPRLARKVLAQDDQITASQYANFQRLPEQQPILVAADVVSRRVLNLRQQAIAGESHSPPPPQTLHVNF